MIILSLVALTVSSIRSDEKAALIGPAGQVAESVLDRVIYNAERDIPAGNRAAFWAASGTYLTGQQIRLGGVDYTYSVFAETVSDPTGVPIGTASGEPGNRLKKVDLQLNWFNTAGSAGFRQGYGKMELQITRLVNEVAP